MPAAAVSRLPLPIGMVMMMVMLTVMLIVITMLMLMVMLKNPQRTPPRKGNNKSWEDLFPGPAQRYK